MERRGRIPVAKFRNDKTRSRSRVRDPDYNEQDPETDLFTLLEDNIALKEENKELKTQIEELKKSQNVTLEEKNRIREQLFSLERQQESTEMQIREITGKLTKANNERNALDKLHKLKIETITSLEHQLKSLQLNSTPTASKPVSRPLTASNSLREKLIKILPTLHNSHEMDSLIDTEPTDQLPLTSEVVERLVDEFLNLRNSFNAVELQLYEANEKIAELIESQHHIEEENETLRSENTNLTKVAKLLTENMKESVETSKKMETALIKLKQRNDELVAKSRDWMDGKSSECPSPDPVPIVEEKAEVEQPTEVQNERIVEMKNILEAVIQKTTNDEIKTLQLKLEILEEELRKANERAELAEIELEKYRKHEQGFEIENEQTKAANTAVPPPPPPPPPPPLPAKVLYQSTPVKAVAASFDGDCSFSEIIAAHNINNSNNNNKENSKIIDNILHQVQPEAATGVDALVRELKSGRVTLRRNRRQTRTNPALQEMFDMLEISQKQNRNSKICIDLNR